MNKISHPHSPSDHFSGPNFTTRRGTHRNTANGTTAVRYEVHSGVFAPSPLSEKHGSLKNGPRKCVVCMSLLFIPRCPCRGWPIARKSVQSPPGGWLVDHFSVLSTPFFENGGEVNPFRAAVLFWGQTTRNFSGLSPKRDCGSKRVKVASTEQGRRFSEKV